jgi:transposase
METNTPTAVKQLKKLTNKELVDLVISLRSDIFLLKQYAYARKSERSKQDPIGMDLLFNEIESTDDVSLEADETVSKEVKGHTREYKRGKRKPLPEDLKRIRKEFDLSTQEKICQTHNTALIKIGEDISEKLDIVPASIHVIQEVTFKYKCPCCSKENEKENIISSKKPESILPKSNASAGLLAHIAVSKFEDSLPLYRQERIFKRCNIDISRSTMSRWMIKVADQCQPLINLMHEDLLSSSVLHCDETHVQVLNEKGRKPEQKSYMWTLARNGPEPVCLFKYEPSRSGKAARKILDGFKGTLVTDAYVVYDSLAMILAFKLACCLAHIRRKFFLAEKQEKQSGAKKGCKASVAMAYIRQIYAIEKSIAGATPEKRLEIRQSQSKKVYLEMESWLLREKDLVLPGSLTGKAISYALNQWEKMGVFLRDPFVPVDNNFIEAQIRNFAIGRKNWMFSATENGAHSSAILYSLIVSAKLNGIQPFDYLHLIFKELPLATCLEDFEKLLPYIVKKHFSISE